MRADVELIARILRLTHQCLWRETVLRLAITILIASHSIEFSTQSRVQELFGRTSIPWHVSCSDRAQHVPRCGAVDGLTCTTRGPRCVDLHRRAASNVKENKGSAEGSQKGKEGSEEGKERRQKGRYVERTAEVAVFNVRSNNTHAVRSLGSKTILIFAQYKDSEPPLFSEFFSGRGSRVADLVKRSLKLIPAYAEMLGPTANFAFFVHRNLAAIG